MYSLFKKKCIVNSLLLKETDQCYLRETIVTIYVCCMDNMFDWCLNVQWQSIHCDY